MNSQVSFEVALVGEMLATVATSERFDPHVNQCVSMQFFGGHEFPHTQLAFELAIRILRVILSNVTAERFHTIEMFTTNTAREELFHSWS